MVLIPIIAFILLFLAFVLTKHEWGWRLIFLRSAIIWSTYCVFLTEVLSLLRRISHAGLTIGWLIPSFILSGYCISIRGEKEINLPRVTLNSNYLNIILTIATLLILGLVLIVAFVYPPTEFEVMHYQMSRIAHWAQERSLNPYITGVELQNTMAPGAHVLVLNLYILSGGDQLANTVQWFSMLACVIGATLLASKLGSNHSGQLFSGFFVATIPMGIALASSAEVEYVLSFFIICVVFESLDLITRDPKFNSILFAGLAAGLAILTKVTALIFLLPFAVAIAIAFVARGSILKALYSFGAAFSLVILLNIGHSIRVYKVIGGLFDPAQVRVFNNNQKDLKGLVSNTTRNAAIHFGVRNEKVNDWIYFQVLRIHAKLGQDINDPRTTVHTNFKIPPLSPSTGTSNPLHSVLIFLTFLSVVLYFKKCPRKLVAYNLLVAASFILISFLFRWQVFGNRYHLPFFILFAPLIGTVITRHLPRAIILVVVILAFFISWDMTVHQKSRPLISDENIFVTVGKALDSRNDLYGELYQQIASRILQIDCQNVGLMISGAWPSAEYPFWALLDAPRDDLQIEWLVTGTPSARFSEIDFKACAIICDLSCPNEWQTIRGLPLSYENGGFRLYSEFTP